MADVIVPVTQYRETMVSRKSLVKRDSGSPPQSLQDRQFSRIRAASPAGESFSA
jgi:hypothetical protein